MPPHILPSGDKRGPGVAGGADGAVAGGGSELTTPVGVNTGMALALAPGLGATVAVAVGACAPGAGFAWDEQPATMPSVRTANNA